jgi:glycosyltransferase involved in cell wall biosynthesis
MNVVHLIPQLRFGAGRYVMELAARQARTDWCRRVHVLVSTDAEPPFVSDPRLIEELIGRGVPVHVTGDFFHRHLQSLHSASRQIAERAGGGESWLAHAHTAMAAAAARMAGASVVVGACHGVAQGRPESVDLQDALAWRMCDAVVSPSRHWACRLRDHFAVTDPIVLPYGLDLATYPAGTSTGEQAGRPVRLVTVAELTPRKGIDILLEALTFVWRRHPGVECHLFGDGDAAPVLRELADRVDTRGNRIVFHGHVARPYDQLFAYDVFVLPSRSDNQPIAAIEAMLARRPVVATDVGGLGELVHDGRCGWVVPPEDASALAAALIAAVDAGPAERERLGEVGETFARREFDIESAVDAMRRLYARACRFRRHYPLR